MMSRRPLRGLNRVRMRVPGVRSAHPGLYAVVRFADFFLRLKPSPDPLPREGQEKKGTSVPLARPHSVTKVGYPELAPPG